MEHNDLPEMEEDPGGEEDLCKSPVKPRPSNKIPKTSQTTAYTRIDRQMKRKKLANEEQKHDLESDELNKVEEKLRQRAFSKSKGRGFASRESETDFRQMQNTQRQRRKQQQLLRAGSRKPKKFERETKKHKKAIDAPDTFGVRLSPNEMFVKIQKEYEEKRIIFQNADFEALPELERKNQVKEDWIKHLPRSKAKIEEEWQKFMNSFNLWQMDLVNALQSKGASEGLSFDQVFGSQDLRRYFVRSEDAFKKHIEKFMEFKFYREVLKDESVAYTSPLNATQETQAKKISKQEKTVERMLEIYNKNICKTPGCGGTIIVNEKASEEVCSRCGLIVGRVQLTTMNFLDKVNYSKATLPYEPLSHFKEFISRLQGLERTEIPQNVIDDVKKRCAWNRIDPRKDPEQLTYSRCRSFLQDERHANCFENICQIISIVTGRRPVILDQEQVDLLTMMFLQIIAPYQQIKGKRRNMLSYSFTTYKSCEILGYTEPLKYLPLFRDPNNTQKADVLWKGICDVLKYEFIPSR